MTAENNDVFERWPLVGVLVWVWQQKWLSDIQTGREGHESSKKISDEL